MSTTALRSIVIVLLCLLPSLLFSAAQHSDSQTIVISDVNVIPMDTDRVLDHRTVVVRNGKIAAIVSAGVRTPKDALWIDGRGKYLMPGLADLHVHLFSPDDLLAYTMHGVTTVLNMDGGPAHLRWRAQVRQGKVLGPTIYTAGHTIDGFPPLNEMFLTAETAEQARGIVRQQKRAGYDFIKLYGTLRPEVFQALVEMARQERIAVVGHVNRQVGALEVLKSPQVLAAHLEDLVAARFDHPPIDAELEEFADTVARSHITVTPNLNVNAANIAQLQDLDGVLASPAAKLLSSAAYSQWMPANNRNERSDQTQQQIEFMNAMQGIVTKLVRLLSVRNVRLVLGSDSSPYGFPGLSAHQELQELVAAGVSPYEALLTATRSPGTFIGEYVAGAPRFGTVTKGAAADLLLLSANPLESIKNADVIEGVVLRGRWLPMAELKRRRGVADARIESEKREVERIDAALVRGDAALLTKEVAGHVHGDSPAIAEWVLMTKARKLQEKDLKSSIGIAELNTRSYPESFSAPLVLADLLFRAGRVADARRQAMRSLALEPHNAASVNLLDKISAVQQAPGFEPSGTYRLEYVNDQSHDVHKADLLVERMPSGQYGGKKIDGEGPVSVLQSVVIGGGRIWAVADSPFGSVEFRIIVKGSDLSGYWAGPFGQNGMLRGTKSK